MSSTPKIPANKYLIFVDVRVFGNGQAEYTYSEFLSRTPLPDRKLSGVKTADTLGFALSALVNGRRMKAPYKISFANSNLLGVRDVDVPNGGSSRFHSIEALGGTFKYTVSLPTLAIEPDDPEIQMDSAFNLLEVDFTISDAWGILVKHTAAGGFEFSYTKNGSTFVPGGAGLPVQSGDALTWTLDEENGPAEFDVVFEARSIFYPQMPVVADPQVNTIHGDTADTGSKTMTKQQLARKLQAQEPDTFPYSIQVRGKTSEPPQKIKLSNR